ncbi:MAG: hypothetical protein JSV96_11255 [Candidatus Aminicenantes bacterium]|nr:MAG: hypothetical protein JSV96_11255 [Candidatus Aminicenantes bacterium]
MEEGTLKNKDTELPENAYELLSRTREGTDITVRDDQHDFSSLLDSVKKCRKRGLRFRLIDSGVLDGFNLEWLGKAGADIYTSDEIRIDALELELMKRACKKGKAFLSYFYHGPLESDEPENEADSLSFTELKNLARNGVYFYITNRERKLSFSALNELAHACLRGRSWLVYYHFGPIEPALEELGLNGAWIHITDQSFYEDGDTNFVLDAVKSSLSSGMRMVVHVEKELDYSILRDIMSAGAYVLFKYSLFDYKSPFRSLEREARKRKPDFRACYLYPNFLP